MALKNTGRCILPCLILTLLSATVLHAEDVKGPHIVTDMAGRTVEVPASLKVVADLWLAHNSLLIMLKSADRIKVTIVKPQMMPWMFKIAPSLKNATLVDATNPSLEVLKREGVEAAFLYDGANILGLERLGIPAIQGSFYDLETMLRSIFLTADVLGTDEAKAAAQNYEMRLCEKIAMLQARLKTIRQEDRPRILHITFLDPIKIDGKNTIIDQWISTAGARNAADLSGNQKQVSLEEIMAMDPDIIIIGNTTKKFDPATAGGLWFMLRAVKEKHVYRNPMGAFPWDRYGPEFLLQILWAAKISHPQLFADIDMKKETIGFYHDFFGYDLDPSDADLILAGKAPQDYFLI